MNDGVTVSVQVPAGPDPIPDPTPSVPGHAPPTGSPEGPLPFTGIDAGLWLALAIVLVLIGAVVVRRNSPSKEASMKSKFSAPLTLALTLVLMASSALAFAQSTPTVTTQVDTPSRNMAVTDLSGQALQTLALTPGQPRAFKVSVTDTNVVPTDGFTVQSVMNNLYKVTDANTSPVTVDHNSKIASSDVTVSYPATPISALSTAVDLNPDYLLSGAIGCEDVNAILGLGGIVSGDPICDLLGGLLGSETTVIDVPLDGTGIADVDLTSLLPSELPIAIGLAGTDSSGAYTAPDCSGLATGDTSCSNDALNGGTPATSKQYMVGTGLSTVTGNLQSVLEGALPAVSTTPVASVDGTSAIASAEAVIMALQGASDGAVRDLGNALAEYTDVADQVAIINGTTSNPTLSVVRSAIETVDLANVLGTYNSFPMLTVSTASAPSAGQYAGTLTITLVD